MIGFCHSGVFYIPVIWLDLYCPLDLIQTALLVCIKGMQIIVFQLKIKLIYTWADFITVVFCITIKYSDDCNQVFLFVTLFIAMDLYFIIFYFTDFFFFCHYLHLSFQVFLLYVIPPPCLMNLISLEFCT